MSKAQGRADLLGLLLMINLSFLFLLYKDFQNPAPRQK